MVTSAFHTEPSVPPMPSDTVVVTREVLYEQVWTTPMRQLAKDYGVSDVALAKTCRKLDVPVPPRGYWAKLQHGKKTAPRPPLSPVDGARERATVTRSPPAMPPVASDPAIADHVAALQDEGNRIRVADELQRPHPAVRAPRTSAPPNAPLYGRHQPVPEPSKVLPITVSKEHVNRALRILDALAKALEAKGYPVTGDGALIEGQRVQIAIMEKQDRTPHVPTPAELENRKRYGSRLPTWDHRPSGLLRIHCDSYTSERRDLRKSWSDGRSGRLEDTLDEVFLGLVLIGIALRQRADEFKAEEERRAELARQREERERQAFVSAARNKDIVARAEALAQAEVVRRMIAVVEERARGSSDACPEDLGRWLERAGKIAASLDPLSDGLERMLARHEKAVSGARNFPRSGG